MNIPSTSGRVRGPLPIGLLVHFFMKQKSPLLFVSLSSNPSLPSPPCFCSPIFSHLGRDCKSHTPVAPGVAMVEVTALVTKFIMKMMESTPRGVMPTREMPPTAWRTEENNRIEFHTEKYGFPCGTWFRTQITSQVEQSMKGYWKLENVQAGFDINRPFRQRFEKSFARKRGICSPPTDGSTLFAEKREKYQYVGFWNKKYWRIGKCKLYLEVSEKEHPLIMIYHRTQKKKMRNYLAYSMER